MSITCLQASNPLPFTVNVSIDRPIQYLPPSGPATATLTASTVVLPGGQSSTYTYQWTQLQEGMNPEATTGVATINSPTSISTAVSLPAWGVYEFQVTVTDTLGNSTIRRAWVNIWNGSSALGSDPLGVAPGCSPPTTVRNLNSDPGPYQHPRVLCTQQDWPAMNARVTGGSAVATTALNQVQIHDLVHFTDGSSVNRLTNDLLTYAGTSSPYSNSTYEATVLSELATVGNDINSGSGGFDYYYNLLWEASYVAWVTNNQSDLQKFATATAAAAHAHFNNIYSLSGFNTTSPLIPQNFDQIGASCGNSLSGLAIAYDFLYPSMTDNQRTDVRNFLYAAGYERTTGSRNGNTGALVRGYGQNGDFANLNEYQVFLPLVIEGEESSVPQNIQEVFATPPSQIASIWMQPAYGNSSSPYGVPIPTDPTAWPNSSFTSMQDLQREIWWTNDWNVSPWGFTLDREAYFGYSSLYLLPAALAFAVHGGENQFITTYLYNTKEHLIWSMYAGDGTTKCPALPNSTTPLSSIFQGTQYLYDHHDSQNFDYRQCHLIFLKYMFPNDPTIDYIYRQNLPFVFPQANINNMQFPIWFAMFGTDPNGLTNGTSTTLSQVGAFENNRLIKLDAQEAVAVTRSGWSDAENDAELLFDCRWAPGGHYHNEQNSFSFFALGRAWSFAPGYHCTISEAQGSVLVQDPNYVSDPATGGFRGESISSLTALNPATSTFPPTPGHLMYVNEDPNHVYSLMAGDASFSYTYGNLSNGTGTITSPKSYQDMMYPNLFNDLVSRYSGFQSAFTGPLSNNLSIIYPVNTAYRSILFVRSPNPYALIVDDFTKDGATHNYQWSMNSATGFGGGTDNRCTNAQGYGVASSTAIQAGASSTQAVLYHSPVDDAGGPRLLVQDCTEASTSGQPAIRLKTQTGTPDSTYLTYGVDNNSNQVSYIPSNRLLIERDNVVSPQYKVLLYPYMSGMPTPTTTTVVTGPSTSALLINNPGGPTDEILFDHTNPSIPTQMTFVRNPSSLPTPLPTPTPVVSQVPTPAPITTPVPRHHRHRGLETPTPEPLGPRLFPTPPPN